MLYNNLHRSIKDLAQSVEDDLRRVVPKKTGNLANSIKTNVREDGFSVSALSYISYIDKGVSGTERKFNTPFSFKDKMPPANSFQAPTMSGQFAIAYSIFKKGIRPQNFLNSLDIDFDKVVEGFSKDIDQEVNNIL